MSELLFDKLIYMDRLKRAGISDDHARAHAEGMDEALREGVATKLDIARLETAIKADVTRLETAMKADVVRLESRIDVAVRDMTIRMGMMAVALFAAQASIKFFG